MAILLIPKWFFTEMLRFVQSISIEPETSRYRVSPLTKKMNTIFFTIIKACVDLQNLLFQLVAGAPLHWYHSVQGLFNEYLSLLLLGRWGI